MIFRGVYLTDCARFRPAATATCFERWATSGHEMSNLKKPVFPLEGPETGDDHSRPRLLRQELVGHRVPESFLEAARSTG
jgi:hypothetical protein